MVLMAVIVTIIMVFYFSYFIKESKNIGKGE